MSQIASNQLTPLEQAAAGQPDENGEIHGAYMGHMYDLISSGICGKGEAARRRAAYAAWYSAPKQYRQPRTQNELAELLNLKSDQVFYNWKHSKWWGEAINRVGLELLEQFNADAHRRLIHLALSETGGAGVQALRLFFERGGQLTGVTVDLPADSNFERALLAAYGVALPPRPTHDTDNSDEDSE